MPIPKLHALVTDIEGTTTPVQFVHQVLFPYAREHLPAFVRAHASDTIVAEALRETAELDPRAKGGIEAALGVLLEWIAADRKATPLKTLQGLVWRRAYESGAVRSPVYDDVVPLLERAKAGGLRLYVYSSGSQAAQRLLFGHSDKGDLRPLFSGWFDTRIGAKTEHQSYTHIAEAIGEAPATIAFLSDHTGEVKAARQAGFVVCRIDRDQPPDHFAMDDAGSPVAGSFTTAARVLQLSD